jgi:hypothetical protein
VVVRAFLFLLLVVVSELALKLPLKLDLELARAFNTKLGALKAATPFVVIEIDAIPKIATIEEIRNNILTILIAPGRQSH